MSASSADRHGPAIKQLLRDAGGRAWQSDIVDQTGLSESLVSKAVNELDSRGAVEVVDLGRENLVCLPGSVPDAYGPSEEFQS